MQGSECLSAAMLYNSAILIGHFRYNWPSIVIAVVVKLQG